MQRIDSDGVTKAFRRAADVLLHIGDAPQVEDGLRQARIELERTRQACRGFVDIAVSSDTRRAMRTDPSI